MYEVCLKSNETGARILFLNNWTTNQHYPFKVVPLGSHTPPETLLPLPVAVLKVFMWNCPQLVCQGLLDVVHSSKMTTFEVEFEFREKKEVTRTQIRRVWGLWNRWNTPVGQKFVHGDGSVTGRVVVMQHPSVCSLWPDTMNPLSESFKDRTTVLLINCLSWGTNSLWTTPWLSKKQTRMDLIYICSFLLSSGAVSCSRATPNFVVWFRDRTRKSTIHHLLWRVWKTFHHFDAFKKLQAHIPSVFLLFVGEFLLEPTLH